jgi:3'(2'), 5'-bisphosphate nucleotidase
MAIDLSQELDVARTVALEAATVVASFQGRPLGVEHKAGGEPVSLADIASSNVIVARLQQAFPDDAILSEELPDNPQRLTASRVWMIDPIDGTRDFVRGEPGYVVMIGLVVEGRPKLGVVVQPSTRTQWSGAVGLGAWKETPAGKRTPIQVATADPTTIRLVSSKSHRTEYYARFAQALGITDEMRLGSVGLKVALIAEGSRDLYAYPGGQTKIWDSCAPEAILTAAGGRLTDSDGKDLCYTDLALPNPRGIVASNGLVHDRALAAIAKLRTEINASRTRG